MKSLTSITPNLDLVSEFIKETEDNPVQAVLRAALERLGPNGENWGQGGCCTRPTGTHCILAAINGERVPSYDSIEGSAAGRALIRAVGGYSIYDVYLYNDTIATSFADIQGVILRAISLSA